MRDAREVLPARRNVHDVSGKDGRGRVALAGEEEDGAGDVELGAGEEGGAVGVGAVEEDELAGGGFEPDGWFGGESGVGEAGEGGGGGRCGRGRGARGGSRCLARETVRV